MKPHFPSALLQRVLLTTLFATLFAASQAANIFQIPPKSQIELFPGESTFLSFIICDHPSLHRAMLIVKRNSVRISDPMLTDNVTLHYNSIMDSDYGVVYAVWPWTWQPNNNNNNNNNNYYYEECREFIMRALNMGQNYDIRIELSGHEIENYYFFDITFLSHSPPDNTQQQQQEIHKQRRVFFKSFISPSHNNVSIDLVASSRDPQIDALQSSFSSYIICYPIGARIRPELASNSQPTDIPLPPTLPYKALEEQTTLPAMNYTVWRWNNGSLACDEVISRVLNKPQPNESRLALTLLVREGIDTSDTDRGSINITLRQFSPQKLNVTQIPHNRDVRLYPGQSQFLSMVACSPEALVFDAIHLHFIVNMTATQDCGCSNSSVDVNLPPHRNNMSAILTLPYVYLRVKGWNHTLWGGWSLPLEGAELREVKEGRCWEMVSRVLNGEALRNYSRVHIQASVWGTVGGHNYTLDSGEFFDVELLREIPTSQTTPTTAAADTTQLHFVTVGLREKVAFPVLGVLVVGLLLVILVMGGGFCIAYRRKGRRERGGGEELERMIDEEEEAPKLRPFFRFFSSPGARSSTH